MSYQSLIELQLRLLVFQPDNTKFTYKSFFPILIHVLECTFMHVQSDKIKTLFKVKEGWHQIAKANKLVALYNRK